MNNYTETAVANVSKECFTNQKEDSGFVEFIVKQISSELAERIMGILGREEEIIVRQSDLRVSEFKPTQSMEYRRQINWSPLVRCKDCKWGREACGNIECSSDFAYHGYEWYCPNGERREDDSK